MKIYKKEIIILICIVVLSILSFTYIKNTFYSGEKMDSSAKKIAASLKKDKKVSYNNELKYKDAVTARIEETTTIKSISTGTSSGHVDEVENLNASDNSEYPYKDAPTFDDDGSLIYDGMTLTELTNKLNLSLNDYLTNTGYFFAEYTKKTGLDPYLSVAIVLLETGCKWSCSSLTRDCNNIGGLKGGPSCNGNGYKKYNTLGEGIDGFLDILYNKYYLNGMKTAEEMASTYAASSEWTNKVNTYMNEIKAK